MKGRPAIRQGARSKRVRVRGAGDHAVVYNNRGEASGCNRNGPQERRF
jgi:hypothetical protein